MKNISYILLAFLFIIISCDKDDSGLVIDKTSSDSLMSYAGDGSASGESSGGGEGNGEDTQVDPGQITAGEWNDLMNWDFWKNLENEQDYNGMADYWDYNLDKRISVKLTNSSAVPLVDIKVELLDKNDEVIWLNRTDNAGTAELWPYLENIVSLDNEDLKIRVGTEIFNNVKNFAEGINEISISSDPTQPGEKIDIAFMVDATGSMSDELEYLKVELIDVIEQVKSDNPDVVINMGSVFYRDVDDNYVTRKREFSTNTTNTINFIKDQSANGGGDFPEAVHTALNVSLNSLQWSSTAKSRLLFILLDAPPHYETQVVNEIHSLIKKAAEMGVKIIPITASGIDKETEFLMRYFSIATNGSYVFITNHSGIGGEHLEPTVGQYDVEYLNELMIRLINKNLE